MKYFDMYTAFKNDETFDMTKEELTGAMVAFQWLDEHPDQVPGQELTESELDAAQERAGIPNHPAGRKLAFELGRVIVTDPEPTNAEKATADLETWGISRGPALELGAWLAGQGWMRTPDHE